MPLLILIAMIACIAVIDLSENNPCNRRKEPFTADELNELSRLMVGKSQKACRRVLKEFNAR